MCQQVSEVLVLVIMAPPFRQAQHEGITCQEYQDDLANKVDEAAMKTKKFFDVGLLRDYEHFRVFLIYIIVQILIVFHIYIPICLDLFTYIYIIILLTLQTNKKQSSTLNCRSNHITVLRHQKQ